MHMADSEQTTTTPEAMRDAVISMAVESWRFGRVFDRLLTKLDAGEQNRYKSQFRWFIKKVEDALEQVELRTAYKVDRRRLVCEVFFGSRNLAEFSPEY